MIDIREEYFEWMYQIVNGKKYYRLLNELNNVDFISLVHYDENRIRDGIDLRYRFADEANIPVSIIDRKFNNIECSVLEVMVALSVRIEESIMGDEDYGNRIPIWFSMMIKSLGLYDMTDDKIEYEYVTHTIARFLNRDYDSNGSGGLFTIHDYDRDMRDIEIWYQMCLFFDNLL